MQSDSNPEKWLYNSNIRETDHEMENRWDEQMMQWMHPLMAFMTRRFGGLQEIDYQWPSPQFPVISIRSNANQYRSGFGTRPKVAIGLIAIGDIAVGLVACGAISFGILSFGAIALGIWLALGAVAMSGSLAAGAVAIASGISVGAVAIGEWALGAVAIAEKALGVVSIGEWAFGVVAIGAHGFGLIPIIGDLFEWFFRLF